MTTAALTSTTRDPFMPQRPPGMRVGLGLALLAHALLIAGLAYSVDWHTSDPVAIEAELWSAVPQQAAPRPVEAPPPAPAPTPAPAPAPAPKPAPAPPAPPPQVDPQIAIDKARDAKRVAQEEAAEQEQARRDKARRQAEADRKAAEQQAREDAQKKKQAADKLLAQKQQADKKAEQTKAEQTKAEQAKADQAEAAQREADRQKFLKRQLAMAGATGDADATGSALRSSGPSASYAGRIVARIKPNIVFPDAVDGIPVASVEVRVAPDGSITARRLVQSSGVKAWDDAVLRAIDRTDGLPRDIDGRVPPVMTINFRPRDL